MKEIPLNSIYVDFDNTLSKTKFNSDTGHYECGDMIPEVVSAVAGQYLKGRDIVIFTARPEEEWDEVKQWLDDQSIPYNEITNIKKPAIMYVDDKALRPDEFVIFDKWDRRKKSNIIMEEPLDTGEYDSYGEKI